MWPKLKSSITRTAGSSREQVNNLSNKLNVNEEYTEAFRTKSYIDIWRKVQGQLRRTSKDRLSISPFPYTHLSDYLLEPRQEVLIDIVGNSNLHLHHLLIDYFEASLEASKICGFLLQSIDQTRADYCRIQTIINLAKCVFDSSNFTNDQCGVIYRELSSFAKLDNPLSGSNQVQLHLFHDKYGLMLDQLTITRKKITRRVKVIGLCKKAAGLSLVIVYSTLLVVTLVLALHSLVGIVASPALFTALAVLKRRIKLARVGMLDRLSAQLDAAAKGVYILNKDFDTMSRLVTRLHVEIEHDKGIAGMCLRNQKRWMLMEVVREFKAHESCFLEQLGELEEHVYLCFLTINRARKLVIQEIVADPQNPLDSSNLDCDGDDWSQ